MGRMILEVVKEDVTEYKRSLYGMAEDSRIILAETENERVPLKKGIILEQSPDCYGERYQKYYGTDGGYTPKVGDTVMFIPHQQYNLTPDGSYCIIGDEHVIAFTKGKENDK